MIEYVDHLHEHFVDPVKIRQGRYLMPSKPGYSIEIREDTLERYCFPDGEVWNADAAVEAGARENGR